MSELNFIDLLPTLHNQRQIIVIGSAVIDVIADAYSLPYRGSDIELHQQSINVGGCAFNVAVTIKQLGLSSQNALPIGQGTWSEMVSRDLAKKGISSIIHNPSNDNGWCLALVEPDGERTFLSVSGVENQWDLELLSQISPATGALIYLSGYQLAASCADVIVSWLESLKTPFELYIDFGPRIADITPEIHRRLLALKPIMSLNRQETLHIQENWLDIQQEETLDIDAFTTQWQARFDHPIIIRVDSEGAFFYCDGESGHVPAFQANVVDTIGAGDSHAGGVLCALASGWSLKEAVTLGNAVASYVVSHRGGDCAPSVKQLIENLTEKSD